MESIVRLLLARPEFDVNLKDHYGYNALVRALKGGNCDIVGLLLAQPGVAVNAKDSFNRSAL